MLPQNSYAEALIPTASVSVDKAFRKFRVKWGHKGAVLIQKDWWSYKRWGDPAHLSPLYMDTEKKWPSSRQEKSSHQNSTMLALWSPTFSLFNCEKCFCFSSHLVYGILWQQPHVRQLLSSWLCGSIPVSTLQALNTVISLLESNEATRCKNVVSFVLSFQSWIFLGSSLIGGGKLCTLKTFTGVVSFRSWNQKYTAIWPSNPTTGLVPRENRGSEGCMHPNIHCSTLSHSQDVEAT